ncbi:MAG: Fe-S oxidoreductase [Acidobacteria bacterium]|nr:Fe-S oxidoreductase [Acidobacteriota bacterium]
MPDEPLTEEKIIREVPRMTLDSTFTFRCEMGVACFTRCCADVSIVLTPYDIQRMKKALGLDSSEFLARYTISPFTPDQKFPVVLLKMNPESRRCLHVTESGCSIYRDRPWACRMYPLGLAQPEQTTSEDRDFHFLIHEELCQGHGEGRTLTVRDWIEEQGIEEYNMMGASFKELMLHPFWNGEKELTPAQMDMFFMACYDLDRFRRFVFETRLLRLFDVHEARVEAMRTDDLELLDFALQWLRFSLFQEKTMKIKPSAARSAGRADSREGLS